MAADAPKHVHIEHLMPVIDTFPRLAQGSDTRIVEEDADLRDAIYVMKGGHRGEDNVYRRSPHIPSILTVLSQAQVIHSSNLDLQGSEMYTPSMIPDFPSKYDEAALQRFGSVTPGHTGGSLTRFPEITPPRALNVTFHHNAHE
ncbi:hypothetical protein NMY22_g3410 [Coprinellus aureogranulatus]|nr:hypothetical protein NMY22_g3410 [Coprinellus aureogranulatus]